MGNSNNNHDNNNHNNTSTHDDDDNNNNKHNNNNHNTAANNPNDASRLRRSATQQRPVRGSHLQDRRQHVVPGLSPALRLPVLPTGLHQEELLRLPAAILHQLMASSTDSSSEPLDIPREPTQRKDLYIYRKHLYIYKYIYIYKRERAPTLPSTAPSARCR